MASHTMGLFAFGMSATIIFLTLFWRDLPYPRFLAVLGGVWAIVPQLVYELPYVGARLVWLPDHWLSNVFWLNSFIVSILHSGNDDPIGQHHFTALFIVILAVTLLWAEQRGYRTPDVVAGLFGTDKENSRAQ